MQDSPTRPSGGTGPRWPWFAAAAISIAALLVLALFFLKRPEPGAGGLAPEISAAQAAAMRERGTFVLDVREPDEWSEAHVPGSTLIPLGQLQTRLSEVPRDREIVVLCRSGNRSRRGRDILLAAGYENVASVAGGITAWAAEGHPTVAGP